MPSEVEILGDLQLLQDDEPGRVRRRLQHAEAAIVDADRLLSLGLEFGEVGLRDQRAAFGQRRGEPAGEGAAIEGLGPVGGDFLERAGQVGLDDKVPTGGGSPSRRKIAALRRSTWMVARYSPAKCR